MICQRSHHKNGWWPLRYLLSTQSRSKSHCLITEDVSVLTQQRSNQNPKQRGQFNISFGRETGDNHLLDYVMMLASKSQPRSQTTLAEHANTYTGVWEAGLMDANWTSPCCSSASLFASCVKPSHALPIKIKHMVILYHICCCSPSPRCGHASSPRKAISNVNILNFNNGSFD